jgi:sugar lactone lactonase YvrE
MSDAPQLLKTGLTLGESPRWHDGRLWLADWLAGEVIALLDDGDGAGVGEAAAEVVARVPSFPICIDWLPDGRLLAVSGRQGLLLRQEADGALALHADLRAVADPPWNDLVADGRGGVWVNCTGFDFPAAPFAPGAIAHVASDGSVRQVADGLAFPNGMVLADDGATLIVAESYAGRLTAFAAGEDGSLSQRRAWAEVEGSAPDGICIDAEGAVWFADVPNRSCVRVREGGEVVQRIAFDRGCFACALGGPDGRTLYVTAADWRGPASVAGGERTGVVVGMEVDVPAPPAA